jgi:hypothetical protein
VPVLVDLGQDRAMSALAFGVALGERGFNIYVARTPRVGSMTVVRRFLERLAGDRPTPDDWCYLHNVDDPVRPHALRLPAGQGRRLRDGVRALIAATRREIPKAFESEEYINGYETIIGDLSRRREEGMVSLSSRAKARGFMLQVTPMGIGLMLMANGQPTRRGPGYRRGEEYGRGLLRHLSTARAVRRAGRDPSSVQHRQLDAAG